MKAKDTFLRLIAGLIFALSASVAHAVVIDDWNVDTTVESIDPPGGQEARGTSGVSLPRTFLEADGGLSTFDSVRIADCSLCQAGDFDNDEMAVGWGYWEWDISSVNFGVGDTFAIDYQTDVDNGDLILVFGAGGTILPFGQDLAATGLNVLPGPLAGGTLTATLATDESAATTMRLYALAVAGVQNDGYLVNYDAGAAAITLDMNVDNLRVDPIPIPPALWLFGSGLLGLVGMARRKRAA